MIVNAYAVLDAFISVLRILLALLILCLGALAWWKCGRLSLPEARKRLEDGGSLLFQLALLLLGLNLVSWPLLYLLLQSYVTEWPGVMCIYGVTQIGAGSIGISRFLPGLLKTLELTKPTLVFCSGAWFVLYLVNRRSRTAPLMKRIFAALIVLGVLAEVDALAETTYLMLPKKEEFLSAGCCAEAFDRGTRGSRFLPAALLGNTVHPWLYGAYFGINTAMVLGLFGMTRRLRSSPSIAGLWPLLLGAALAVPVSGLFLIEIASPLLLHLPYHHCPYDLLPKAPESVLAIALFLGGTFSVGWACVAGWLASTEETRPIVYSEVRRLLGMGLCCYLGSLVMMSAELALA